MAIRPAVDQNLAIDSTALNRLKHSAQSQSAESIRAVARQFEGVLMQMMLKSMRDTVPQDGAFDNDQSRMFTGMLDQQLSQQLSQKGLGLTDVLVRQLSRQAAPATLTPATLTPATLTPATLTPATLTPTTLTPTTLTQTSLAPASLAQAAQAAATTESSDSTKPVSLRSGSDLFGYNALVGVTSHTLVSDVAYEPTTLSSAAQRWMAAAQALQADHPVSSVQPGVWLGTVANAVSHSVSTASQRFIQAMLPHAQAASSRSGIPAQFMVGQAALESGWGKHEIKTADGGQSYNLFGIKADARWTGKVVTTKTTEYIQGVKQTRLETFRAYDSYAEAFQDYAKLISHNPRYQQAMQNTHSASAYATALQQAGYATDPLYSKKLTQVIHKVTTA